MNRLALTPRRRWSVVARAGTAVSAIMLMISVVSVMRADALPDDARSTVDQPPSRTATATGGLLSVSAPTPTDQPPTTDEATTTSSSSSTTSTSTTTSSLPPTTTILGAGGPTTTSPPEPSSPPPSLPHTGPASLAVVFWAILLLVFGRMAVLVARPVKVTEPRRP